MESGKRYEVLLDQKFKSWGLVWKNVSPFWAKGRKIRNSGKAQLTAVHQYAWFQTFLLKSLPLS